MHSRKEAFRPTLLVCQPLLLTATASTSYVDQWPYPWPTAPNFFELVLINENMGRECEAPLLVDIGGRPIKAPQERRPTALNIFEPILINENVRRECEAPAELFRAADTLTIACGR
jgi:hypothetical protein